MMRIFLAMLMLVTPAAATAQCENGTCGVAPSVPPVPLAPGEVFMGFVPTPAAPQAATSTGSCVDCDCCDDLRQEVAELRARVAALERFSKARSVLAPELDAETEKPAETGAKFVARLGVRGADLVERIIRDGLVARR